MARLILRKSWRLGGIIFPLIYYFSSKITTIFVLLPILCFFIFIEIARFYIARFNERIFVIFRNVLKERERKNLFTTTTFLLSTLLTLILFRKDITITALTFLIFGDTASAFVGSYYGRTKIFGKTIEGSIAFLSICLLIGLLLNFTAIRLPWQVIICGALAATITELLPLAIDDNFTVALSCGIVMTLVSRMVS